LEGGRKLNKRVDWRIVLLTILALGSWVYALLTPRDAGIRGVIRVFVCMGISLPSIALAYWLSGKKENSRDWTPQARRMELMRKEKFVKWLLFPLLLLALSPSLGFLTADGELSFEPPSDSLWIAYTDEVARNCTVNVTNVMAFDMNLTVAGKVFLYPAGCEANLTRNTTIASGEEISINITLDVQYLLNQGIYEGVWGIWFNWTKANDPNTNGSINYLMRIRIEEPIPPGNLEFDPDFLSLAVERNKQKQAPLQITNNYDYKATIWLSYSPDWASVSPSSFELNPHTTTTITVTMDATNKVVGGNYTDFLEFSYTLEGFTQQFKTQYSIRMSVIEPIQEPKENLRVELTILSSVDDSPVEGARVILGQTYYGTTNPKGFVAFTNIPEGAYECSITKEGYERTVTTLYIYMENAINGTFKKILHISPEEEEEPEQAPTQTPTPTNVTKGQIGLPFDTIKVELEPGMSVRYDIPLSAEGGPVGPIEIRPVSSLYNWITLIPEVPRANLSEYEVTFAILNIEVPIIMAPGKYSRQFTITGGHSPVTFNVQVQVVETLQLPGQNGTPLGPGIPGSGEMPSVVVKFENDTAISPGTHTVKKGTIIIVSIAGDYDKVEVKPSNASQISPYGHPYYPMGGVKNQRFQINGPGDLSIYLITIDEYGNKIKSTPDKPGYGVYTFKIKKERKGKRVLIKVKPDKVTVGDDIIISARLVTVDSQGIPHASNPYDGYLYIRTPSGGKEPLALDISGEGEFTPLEVGEYVIEVPEGILIEKGSETRFSATPYIKEEYYRETVWKGGPITIHYPYGLELEDVLKVYASPEKVEKLEAGQSAVTFIPSVHNEIYTITVEGTLLNSYDGMPPGTHVILVLRGTTPVRRKRTAMVGDFFGAIGRGLVKWSPLWVPMIISGIAIYWFFRIRPKKARAQAGTTIPR